MTPLPIKDAPTINMANRNEGPNLFLGNKVIGPFLRNRVTPNEADRTLVANVARKNQSIGFIPSKSSEAMPQFFGRHSLKYISSLPVLLLFPDK